MSPETDASEYPNTSGLTWSHPWLRQGLDCVEKQITVNIQELLQWLAENQGIPVVVEQHLALARLLRVVAAGKILHDFLLKLLGRRLFEFQDMGEEIYHQSSVFRGLVKALGDVHPGTLVILRVRYASTIKRAPYGGRVDVLQQVVLGTLDVIP